MKGSYVLLFLLVAWAVESTVAHCKSSGRSSCGRHLIKIVGRSSGSGYSGVPCVYGFASPLPHSGGVGFSAGCIPSGVAAYAHTFLPSAPAIPTSVPSPVQYAIPIQPQSSYPQYAYPAAPPQSSPAPISYSSAPAPTYLSAPAQYQNPYPQNQYAYPAAPPQSSPAPTFCLSEPAPAHSNAPAQYGAVPTQYQNPYPQNQYAYSAASPQSSPAPTLWQSAPAQAYLSSPAQFGAVPTQYQNPSQPSFPNTANLPSSTPNAPSASCPPCVCVCPSTASESNHPEHLVSQSVPEQSSSPALSSHQVGINSSPTPTSSQSFQSIQPQTLASQQQQVGSSTHSAQTSQGGIHSLLSSQYQPENQQPSLGHTSAQLFQGHIKNQVPSSISSLLESGNPYLSAASQQQPVGSSTYSAQTSQGGIHSLLSSQYQTENQQPSVGHTSAQLFQGHIKNQVPSSISSLLGSGNQYLSAASQQQQSASLSSPAPVVSYYLAPAQDSLSQASSVYPQSSSVNSNPINQNSNQQRTSYQRRQTYNSLFGTTSNLDSPIYEYRVGNYKGEPSYLQAASGSSAVQGYGPYDADSSGLRYLYAPEHSLHQVPSSYSRGSFDSWPVSTVSRNTRSEESSAEDSDTDFE